MGSMGVSNTFHEHSVILSMVEVSCFSPLTYRPLNPRRYVHGSRVVCPPTLDHIRILDFNIQPSLPQGFSFRKGLEQLLCTSPTIVPGGSVFSRDVESSLPYLSSTFKMDPKCDSYMIDHERIIGLKVSLFDFQRPYLTLIDADGWIAERANRMFGCTDIMKCDPSYTTRNLHISWVCPIRNCVSGMEE